MALTVCVCVVYCRFPATKAKWIVENEVAQPEKRKYLLSGPFWRKLADLCYEEWNLGWCNVWLFIWFMSIINYIWNILQITRAWYSCSRMLNETCPVISESGPSLQAETTIAHLPGWEQQPPTPASPETLSGSTQPCPAGSSLHSLPSNTLLRKQMSQF